MPVSVIDKYRFQYSFCYNLVMKKISTSDKIYVNKSKIPNSGRGVYAKNSIKKGEIIENCPIIKVSEHDADNLKESILVTYFFYFGKKKEQLAVALGFGSIYNHSHNSNAKYKINPLENTIDFIALKDIKKDDEIMINYNPAKGGKNKYPLWFESASQSN